MQSSYHNGRSFFGSINVQMPELFFVCALRADKSARVGLVGPTVCLHMFSLCIQVEHTRTGSKTVLINMNVVCPAVSSCQPPPSRLCPPKFGTKVTKQKYKPNQERDEENRRKKNTVESALDNMSSPKKHEMIGQAVRSVTRVDRLQEQQVDNYLTLWGNPNALRINKNI